MRKEQFILIGVREGIPLLANDVMLHTVWDCAVGPSGKEPDFLWDFGDFVLVLEVDEHQHVKYSDADELSHAEGLKRDFPGRRVYILRINSDFYTLANRTRSDRMFEEELRGTTKHFVPNGVEYTTRMTKLIARLKEILDLAKAGTLFGPGETFREERLFFCDSARSRRATARFPPFAGVGPPCRCTYCPN